MSAPKSNLAAYALAIIGIAACSLALRASGAYADDDSLSGLLGLPFVILFIAMTSPLAAVLRAGSGAAERVALRRAGLIGALTAGVVTIVIVALRAALGDEAERSDGVFWLCVAVILGAQALTQLVLVRRLPGPPWRD